MFIIYCTVTERTNMEIYNYCTNVSDTNIRWCNHLSHSVMQALPCSFHCHAEWYWNLIRTGHLFAGRGDRVVQDPILWLQWPNLNVWIVSLTNLLIHCVLCKTRILYIFVVIKMTKRTDAFMKKDIQMWKLKCDEEFQTLLVNH